MPNSVWNVGSATLTTVMSRIDMIAPSTTTPAIFSTAASMWSGRSTGVTLLSEDIAVLLPQNPVSPCSHSVSGCRSEGSRASPPPRHDTGRMQLVFTGQVIEWRGPAPYYFVPVPDEESADIHEVAAVATYGWGVVPVEARIGEARVCDVAVPQGRRLPAAAQGRGPRTPGSLSR